MLRSRKEHRLQRLEPGEHPVWLFKNICMDEEKAYTYSFLFRLRLQPGYSDKRTI